MINLRNTFIAAAIAMTAFCANAQSRGDQFVKQADEALQAKEYVKARYCYLKAYEAYSGESNLDKAIPAAVNVAALYHRESYYKEAFEMPPGLSSSSAISRKTARRLCPLSITLLPASARKCISNCASPTAPRIIWSVWQHGRSRK